MLDIHFMVPVLVRPPTPPLDESLLLKYKNKTSREQIISKTQKALRSLQKCPKILSTSSRGTNVL